LSKAINLPLADRSRNEAIVLETLIAGIK
jgi:hypothetical protein